MQQWVVCQKQIDETHDHNYWVAGWEGWFGFFLNSIKKRDERTTVGVGQRPTWQRQSLG